MQKPEINKMLAAGIMWPSHSPWALPVVLVTKKDGGHHSLVTPLEWKSEGDQDLGVRIRLNKDSYWA